jgi:hypothetical protein
MQMPGNAFRETGSYQAVRVRINSLIILAIKGIGMPSEMMPELDDVLVSLRAGAETSNVIDYATIKKNLTEISLAWEFGWRKNMASAGKAAGKKIASTAIKKGAALAGAAPAVATGLLTGAAVGTFGFGSVLAVWFGAGQVAVSAKTSFKLWDLVPRNKGGAGLYVCKCGKCDAHAYYLAERHDIGVAKFGASLFIVPLIYTAPEKLYNALSPGVSREKRAIAQDLWQSARPPSFPALENEKFGMKSKAKKNQVADENALAIPVAGRSIAPELEGRVQAWAAPEPVPALEQVGAGKISGGCRKAQAIIATLCKEMGNDRTKYSKTLATILSADGVKSLTGKIYD